MNGDTHEVRVLHGCPNAEELAAVLAVLFGAVRNPGPPSFSGTAVGAAVASWGRDRHVTRRHAGSWKSEPI
ncbi:acyl-CoA carboxylase subunit epsilon [Streptomyces sp. NPDC001817]|uniref:acyl-CoA carboxylase subunit epsilon n=1 Tax=Streptomyces sp. NPDC001817 TaxID=3154398 RepID=UPI00332CA0F8